MKKKHVAIALLVGLWLASPAAADAGSVPLDPARWAVNGLGNDETFCLRVGYRATTRTEIGVEGLWADGIGDARDEAFGAGIYAKYDVIQDAKFKVLSYEVDTTVYAGTKAGALFPIDADTDGTNIDATAALIAGVEFGGEQIRLGMEAQLYAPNEWLGWQEFSQLDDSARVLVHAAYRF